LLSKPFRLPDAGTPGRDPWIPRFVDLFISRYRELFKKQKSRCVFSTEQDLAAKTIGVRDNEGSIIAGIVAFAF